jgi:hypothetical protein
VGINRTQALVLGFALAAWLSIVVIVAVDPEIVDAQLKLAPGAGRPAELAFLVALSAFLTLLGVGVVRRWRWMFWLVLLAFLAGLLRVPASALELAGLVPAGGPTWYVLFQGAIGVVQFGIGLAMVAGFRKGGPWAAF